MYLQLFPIYGFMLGINYWNSDLSDVPPDGGEKEHLLQFMFGLIGVSLHWWREQ